ncbi:MAG: hypothetical protein ACMXYB_02560 [Candidatus Woesearchaeota archaeon]
MGSKTHIIEPKTHSLILEFIEHLKNNYENLSDEFRVDKQPTHIVFPQILEENVKFINCCAQSSVLKQYLALKSTFSTSLIEAAKIGSAGAEVSTLNELELVSSLEFEDIIAGGPKSTQYLEKAVEKNVIISIDSIDELERIIKIVKLNREINQQQSLNKKVNVIIRMSDPLCENRIISMKVSRFGISRNQIQKCYSIIEKNQDYIELRGFHFHADGYDADMKKGFCKYFLDQSIELQGRGITSIDMINIGGGFRESTLKNPQEWLYLIQDIEKTLLGKKDLKIWGDYTFGISFNAHNTLQGRSYAESFGVKSSIESDLKTLLHTPIVDNTYTLEQIAQELGISIIIEPGFMLSNNAGISIFSVIGIKQTSCKSDLILVNGHMFNLSLNMIEHLTDPILISNNDIKNKIENEVDNDSEFEGYIVGTLCREDDFLMKRKIKFSKKPQEGDILIFVNTGSYAMSYENCSPQRFELPQYINIIRDTNSQNWQIKKENNN